jgi:hypothetical protein
MNDRDVYPQISALLDDYLQPLGMLQERGPLRAVGELTRGIVFTSSVQLSNAARLWARNPLQLRHAVERLSEHLADPSWDHREWAAAVLHLQAETIDEDDLIPIDPTELAKPYARHMEYRCTVRDGSRVDDPLVQGYWCFGAYHWQPEASSLSALMLRPYSQNQPGFRSENALFGQWFWTLREATSGRGIWLLDRGGDRPEILADLLRVQPRWIVRLREDRGLLGPEGWRHPAGYWADWALAHRPERGRAVTLPVRLPPGDVPQFGPSPPLWLVVPTYTFGNNERWVLLTCGLVDQHAGPRQNRHAYALRWRAEDGKRFLGQIWHVERFLTQSFLALERMLWCVVLASGFVALLQRDYGRLCEPLQREVLYHEKAFTIPTYRLARGLQAVAIRHLGVPMLNNA